MTMMSRASRFGSFGFPSSLRWPLRPGGPRPRPRPNRVSLEELERRVLLYHELCQAPEGAAAWCLPPPEICDDGIDNNYDHEIDEDCVVPPPGLPTPPLAPGLPTVKIEATDPLGEEEGPDSAWFTVYVFDSNGKPGHSSDLVVGYTVGGTAGDLDYTAVPTLSGSLTIPANTPSRSIEIIPSDDTLIELDESVFLTLSSSPDYETDLWPVASAVIVDNDFDLEGGPCKEADFQTTLELTAGVADEIVSVDALCGNVHFDFATWAGFGRGFDGSAFLPEWRSNEDGPGSKSPDFG